MKHSNKLDWQKLTELAAVQPQGYTEIPKFPAVQRDIALVLDKNIPYKDVERVVNKLNIQRLQSIKLFDVFESDKLGIGKKSMAVNLTFQEDDLQIYPKTDIEIVIVTHFLYIDFRNFNTTNFSVTS